MADQDDEVPLSCGCGKCTVVVPYNHYEREQHSHTFKGDISTSSLHVAAGIHMLNRKKLELTTVEAPLFAQEFKPSFADKVNAVYSFSSCPRILKYAERFNDWKGAVQKVRRNLKEKIGQATDIIIEVKTLSGRSMKIQIEPQESVKNIKRDIEYKEDIAANTQKLVFNGKVLEDNNTADFYEIVDGSSVQLFSPSVPRAPHKDDPVYLDWMLSFGS
ncbi:unnamed protein product [Caenorhabditis angaria]|uniref:Ubiquitin-like domain-containing protein n=1 Tax=Caenorhabditis angaria TaxID=860376 RepID=A0A9P1I7Y1_9PELO|nr:unnamed protein product [Caenorhabditis angaria]